MQDAPTIFVHARDSAEVIRLLKFAGENPQPCAESWPDVRGAVLLVEPGADQRWPAPLPADKPVIAYGDRPIPPASNVVASLRTGFSLPDLYQALVQARMWLDQQGYDWEPASRASVRFPGLVGKSKAWGRVREDIGKVGPKDVTVLITGESGTGKELVARAVHQTSARSDGPFVPVNCGAIPGELLESELFGHEKGAFTGAVSTKIGRFELASGGTLFLDEIGDMPFAMQVKLLRALQEKSFERVGSVETKRVNVRVVAATHRNLEAMIETGEFREDLYYRLNVFPIDIAPLRDRPEDVPPLLNLTIKKIEAEQRVTIRFSDAAVAALGRYSWPGNVRELTNLVERLAIARPDQLIQDSDLPQKVLGQQRIRTEGTRAVEGGAELDPDQLPNLPVNGIDLKEFLSRLERSLIEQALDDTNAVVARAANRLHIRRTTLVEKMRKYGIGRN